MAIRRKIGLFALALAVVASACETNPAIAPANLPPIADARVDREGQSYNAKMDGGAAELQFPFMGSPVTVTLDGTHSYDPDGTISQYRWLSATSPPDGGTEGGTPGAASPIEGGVLNRWVPVGEAPNWPGNTASPQVELGQGIWSFSLWVVDNMGAISQPDTIKITIGMVVDPAVQQCADSVVPTEPEACRLCLCNQSDMCRTAVPASVCNQACWNLINCIAANCPDFNAMAKNGDYSCLTMNCSAEYAVGSAGATNAGTCFNSCVNECMSVPYDGGGASASGGSDAAE